MKFSHPDTEHTNNDTPARQDMAHDNLFREPDLAPGTAFVPEIEPPVAPRPRRHDAQTGTRRPVRRRTGA